MRASLTVGMFIDPVPVLPVKPVMMFPVLTPPPALLLGPLLLPALLLGVPWLPTSCLGHLDPPLIGVPSSVDGLFEHSLLEERAADCPLLPDPARQEETTLDRLSLNEVPSAPKDAPGIH